MRTLVHTTTAMVKHCIIFSCPEEMMCRGMWITKPAATCTRCAITLHLMMPMVSQIENETHFSNVAARITLSEQTGIFVFVLRTMFLTFWHILSQILSPLNEMCRNMLHARERMHVTAPLARGGALTLLKRCCKKLLAPAASRGSDVPRGAITIIGQCSDLVCCQRRRLPELPVRLRRL